MAAVQNVQGRELLPSVDERLNLDATSLRRSFYLMSICFSLNHATVTTPVTYASSTLGSEVGNASLATLYFVCMLSALFLGPLASGTLGPKWTMIFGMVSYCIYTICFGVATGYEKGSSEAMTLAIIGSLIGGVGAGTLWTGQGGFFSAICERLADADGKELKDITSELSSSFALFYLGQECFWKVLFSILQHYLGVPNAWLFLFYGGLAAFATVLLALSKDIRPKQPAVVQCVFGKAWAAFSLWPDPKIWLISGNNIAFGFAAAYLNGYINAHWPKEAIGNDDILGFLGAMICLIATFSSKAYGALAEKMGSKVPIVFFGSACFIIMGLLSFITAPDGKGPGGWGWGIMIFYVLQGLGRGVYESTNKGVFGDTFPGAQGTGAFANCMMQNTLSSTIGFALNQQSLSKFTVWIMLSFSVFSVPGLLISQSIQRKEELAKQANQQMDNAP